MRISSPETQTVCGLQKSSFLSLSKQLLVHTLVSDQMLPFFRCIYTVLSLPPSPCRNDSHSQEVKIALVGKYTKLEDSYISVIKALKHASLSCRLRLKLDYISAENLEEECQKSNPIKYHDAWKTVCAANGIIVPGGFGNRGIEGKILAANYARKRNIPYLGEAVCVSVCVCVNCCP